MCRVFTQALARYGSPEELLIDNGKVFTGRLGPHLAEVLFDRICRQHGIAHLCTGVRSPTTTGKIEPWFQPTAAATPIPVPAVPSDQPLTVGPTELPPGVGQRGEANKHRAGILCHGG